MPRSHAARAVRRPTRCLAGWQALVTLIVLVVSACASQQASIPLSELKQHVAAGEVASVVIGEHQVVATPTPDALAAGAPQQWRAVALPDPSLIPFLDSRGVAYEGEAPPGASPLRALLILLGVGGLAGGLTLLYRRGGLASPAGMGGIDVHDAGDSLRKVRYADVMGIDEVKEELEEVVAFLKDPDRFARIGARAPKGILLVGPPGTGKTLLARATAGEAGVPFYSVSGSAFVEMFVGVGAKRVRNLFHKARAHAPSIVFIDEIDAVGKGRGHGFGTNEEREQALNQLLVEMDGFDSGDGIVVMAATNRPEILDAALLRPGRFDRRVTVNVPDREGRRAILGVHARTVRLSPSVDLDAVAGGTPGFAGADLANLVNEAALLAARGGHTEVRPEHFDAAVDRVLAGPERKGDILTEKERQIVAVHEAGHAVVAERRPTAEPVRKISIVPRAVGALGFTQQLPDDRSLLQRDELVDRLCVLLAGRAAEELVFGQVSTGASNDLERASGLARRMVCELGMSSALGPVRYGGGGRGPFIDAGGPRSPEPSEATAAEIDREVRLLVEGQAQAALELLGAERAALAAVADALLRDETLNREDFVRILRGHADCKS